ncbi:MAG: DUF3794 domain-containing protein [Clostridia bacterium]|nr:DUF3794 domain-containing protein [Clostridia bacterium]
MKLIKDSVLVNETVHRDFSEISVDGDIIVPDVKPDILKILQVDAVSTITGKDVGGGRITINGKVNLKILYVPDRAEESVKSIITSFDFVHRADNAAILDGMTAMAESDVMRVEFHLINSRKLSVKTIVAIESMIYANKPLEMVTDVENETAVEIDKKTLSIYNTVAQTEDEFVVKDSIEVPSGKMSIREILKVDYKISDKELKTVTGKIIAKGVINACILYTGEDNSLEFVELDIPFTEVFDVPDVNDNANCEMNYSISDMYFETAADSDGDLRVVNLEFLVEAKIRANVNLKVDVVNDYYCPGWDTKIVREECVIDEIVCQPNSQNTLREIVAIDSNLPQIMGVYNVINKAYIVKTIVEHGKIKVEGIIDSYILYLSDSVDNPVFSYKKEIPFNYILDAPGSEAGMQCDVNAQVEHSGYNLNMANEVELRCILVISAKVTQRRKVSLIKDGELCEISGENKRGIVIYFVQKDDTLWNIAKRYRVAIDEIIKLNDLTPTQCLIQGQQLIIPISRRNIA